jgi:hypothetical protein
MWPGARVTTERWANAVPEASADGNKCVGYPDIICWDCDPTTIYVWEVKSRKEARRAAATRRQLNGYRTGLILAKESNVALGPNLNPPQYGATPRNQFVVVYDGKAPGVQVYETYEQEHQAIAAAVKRGMTSGSVGRQEDPNTNILSGGAHPTGSNATLRVHTTSDDTLHDLPPPVSGDPFDNPPPGGAILDGDSVLIGVLVILAVMAAALLANALGAAGTGSAGGSGVGSGASRKQQPDRQPDRSKSDSTKQAGLREFAKIRAGRR